MSQQEPQIPDVDGTPTSRPEANTRKIKTVERETEEALLRVEELLEQTHERIDQVEQDIRRIELYIGEFGAGDRDE